MSELVLLPDRRTVRWCDMAAVGTTAAFAALGVVAAVQLAALAEIHRTMLEAAHALDVTAQAVALVDQVPFIGDDAGRLAESVRATAAEVRSSATAAREDVRALALVIGIVIVALPVVPLVLLYIPWRLARHRELRRIRQLLDAPDQPALVEHLARAAARRMPYVELSQVSSHPWQDIEQGRHVHLAAAELRRLGIAPPARMAPRGG